MHAPPKQLEDKNAEEHPLIAYTVHITISLLPAWMKLVPIIGPLSTRTGFYLKG